MAIYSSTLSILGGAYPTATMQEGVCIRTLPVHVMEAPMESTVTFARQDQEKAGFHPQLILITEWQFPVMNASLDFGTVCRAVNNAQRAFQGDLRLPMEQRLLAQHVIRVKAPHGRLEAESVTHALMVSSRTLLGCQAVTNAV